MTGPKFEGRVVAMWTGRRDMILLEPFTLIDSAGNRWTAEVGSRINGSSIPRFLWRIVGSPYVGLHRFASVIHDVACTEHWADSPTAHRLYYDGLIAAGVPRWKARIRWLAVRTFGPRWKSRPSKECTSH